MDAKKKLTAPKVLLLNLPAREQITRRYMCSYPSPESLLPPIELLSCAAVARELSGADVYLFDAIAEKKDVTFVANFIADLQPDLIVTLTGFECYEEDIDTARFLKNYRSHVLWMWFGHYATVFPEETLRHSQADYVILGEPEKVIENFLKCFSSGISTLSDLGTISGLAALRQGTLHTTGIAPRIMDPNELPIPAYDLMPAGKYYEPLIDKRYAMMQTMRGCPYQCNYCVKSYGSKSAQLSADRIVEEIKILQRLHGIRSLRFIDDTFTVNKSHVMNLCNRLIDDGIDIEWICLSRTDNLDKEMVEIMKKAGCRRIYFGIESGSQRFLNILGKGLDVQEALTTLKMVQRVGIETAGFFLSGHPEETENDFLKTIEFALQSNLNFVCISPLQAYPGTIFFEQVRHLVDFSIYPYKCEWRNPLVDESFSKRKLVFYSRFYLRFSFLMLNLKMFPRNAVSILIMAGKMVRYLFWDRRFVIAGIKGTKDL